jgi:hypothetical protein
MATAVYRFQCAGVSISEIQQVVGGPPLILGAIAPGMYVDITADTTQLDDLVEAMAASGYAGVLVATDPVVTPETQALGALVNRVSAVVDFGTSIERDVVTVTVPALWVTASSALVATVRGLSPDHPADQDDVLIEGMGAVALNIVAGVSFDVMCSAQNGTWGQYTVEVLGF